MPDADVKTLILRFRDLVTHPGGTIEQHKVIADQQGSVWWGWWNKSGETIPDGVFRSLREAIKASGEGLPVFLVDSGRSQLYQASCSEIYWNIDHQPQPSPDPSITPEYYRHQSYLAWFKFRSIEPQPDPLTLHQFSYVAVPEFFQENRSGYGTFYGKQVSSIDELIQQNRSVWFLRDFRQGDSVHEISLLDPYRLQPADFPADHLASASRHLLWVSDLHFSEDDHHAFPVGSTAAEWTIWLSIEKSLERHGVDDLAGVIVSGDLAWKALPSEFSKAESLFDGARSWARLKPYNFLICPGNHDLAFSKDPAAKGSPIDAAPELARAPYEALYRKLFYKDPNEFLSCGRRLLLGGAIPVEIVCLNSNLLDQQPTLFQGHGFVGERQLDDAARQMGWMPGRGGPRAIRIVVLHHHLLPVTYRDLPIAAAQYSITLDAEAVTRWLLRHEVDLVLHGHMHQPFYCRIARPTNLEDDASSLKEVAVVGAGSAGVRLDHLGEIKDNMFAVLTFEGEEIKIQFYSIHPVNESRPLFDFRVPARR